MCVYVPVNQEAGCGDMTPAPWQPPVFRHVFTTRPPAKSLPWQIWQALKPDVVDALGAFLANAPWEEGLAQPAGWLEGPFAWQVNPEKFAEKQLTPEMPPLISAP